MVETERSRLHLGRDRIGSIKATFCSQIEHMQAAIMVLIMSQTIQKELVIGTSQIKVE